MKNTFLLLALIIYSSCQPDSINQGMHSEKPTIDQIENINKILDHSPTILKLVDEKKSIQYTIDLKSKKLIETKNWSFSNVALNSIYAENGYVTIYASIDNMNENSQTYNIQVGDEELNVKTICLSIDYSSMFSAFGGYFSDFPIDGFSAVVGIDADFSLLSNASSSNIGNFFHGCVSYYVYDFEASGDYDVYDWWNLTEFSDNTAIAYAFIFSDNNFGSFNFSKDGTINVNGGSMSFEGNYYQIDYDFFLINDSLDFNQVSGSGTMGCI